MANNSFLFRQILAFLPAKYRKLARLFLLLGAILVGSGGALFLQGKIIKISDGDTITFAESATQTIKVRLYGIDSPELNQAYGKEAAAFATHIALWQAAKLAVQTTDQYNRSVAIVTLEDGTNLNELLVATGNAWVYRQFCNTPECIKWIALEDQAKQNRLGLWAQKQPLAPWLWRAKNKR